MLFVERGIIMGIDWLFVVEIIVAVVIFILIMAVARRNMNHNYTHVKGMFKMSEYTLDKDEHLDPSDYNFYDDDGLKK